LQMRMIVNNFRSREGFVQVAVASSIAHCCSRKVTRQLSSARMTR
jgi:hypothetical protein